MYVYMYINTYSCIYIKKLACWSFCVAWHSIFGICLRARASNIRNRLWNSHAPPRAAGAWQPLSAQDLQDLHQRIDLHVAAQDLFPRQMERLLINPNPFNSVGCVRLRGGACVLEHLHLSGSPRSP